MLIAKYYSLIIKLLAYLKPEKMNRRRCLIKLFKFFYSLILLPLEILGDIIFSYKRFLPNSVIIPKTILIVKTDQLGDVLFSTMLLPLLKIKYPEARIDYLINPRSDLVLQKNPHINKVYHWSNWLLANIPGRRKFSPASFKDNLKVWRELKRNKYDVIINARAYLPSGNLIWKLLAPKKLIAFNISQQSYLADAWAGYDLYKEEWQNYLNLLKPLGWHDFPGEPRAEYYNFSDINAPAGRLAIISPVSFNAERGWPAERWSRAIQILSRQGYQVVLTGLEAHRNYLETIKGASQAIIFIDSIPKLAELIRKSEIFLGIDSFPAHLAIALNRPVFCLVDTGLYYVKNKSRQVLIDGRCMVPQFKGVKIFDLSAEPEALWPQN